MIFNIKRFNELSTHELYVILQLRSEVFVVEQDCVYQDLDNKDLDAYHVLGVLDKEIEVAVDIYKMMAAKVSFYDVISSIQNGNISISAGNLKKGGQRKTLRIIGEISSPIDLENFVIKSEFERSCFLKPLFSESVI